MRYVSIFLIFFFSLAVFASGKDFIKKPIVVAHYMSWYQTPEISGSWGFWQVNRPTIPEEYWHFPDKILQNGCRDISSVYYPVIGPYDSADPDLCEYHILLAKLAGIDAFVADWYGPEASAEHPYDNIGFSAMKKAAEKLNFKVMICWEDRSMFPPISEKVKSRKEAIERGKEIIKYLQKEWFSSKAYLKIGNRPVLTNYAWNDPGTDINHPWLSSEEWNEILNSINPRPIFIHDWQGHKKNNEFTGYESVMPWGSAYHGDQDSVPAFWERAEKEIETNKNFLFLSGTVLPGFDNRGCGGWGTDGAIGFTSRREGQKYRATWEDNIKHNPKFIQITTWNDLNEGGTIEPVQPLILHEKYQAQGYGYNELETTAEYVSRLKNYPYNKEALRLPAEIYIAKKRLKKMSSAPSAFMNTIENAEKSLLNGDVNKAKKYLQKSKEQLNGALVR
ncbi:MAG: endo-1,3-alpha-glucanase family glycosylhydrolase [Phycisphaerales bacterium]